MAAEDGSSNGLINITSGIACMANLLPPWQAIPVMMIITAMDVTFTMKRRRKHGRIVFATASAPKTFTSHYRSISSGEDS